MKVSELAAMFQQYAKDHGGADLPIRHEDDACRQTVITVTQWANGAVVIETTGNTKYNHRGNPTRQDQVSFTFTAPDAPRPSSDSHEGEEVARLLLDALRESDPAALVEPFSLDDRIIIDGKFGIAAVADKLLRVLRATPQSGDAEAVHALARVLQARFHGPVFEDEPYPNLAPHEAGELATALLRSLREAGYELRSRTAP